MNLPPDEATEAEVKAWVKTALQLLDVSPQRKNWRFRALGMSYGEALANAPEETRVTIRLSPAELRVVQDVARERSLAPGTYVRRALGTWMVAVDEVAPAALPRLLKGGLLR